MEISAFCVLGLATNVFAQAAPPVPDPYAPPPAWGSPSPPYPPPAPYPAATFAAPQQIPPSLIAQWRGARVLTGFGGVTGLLSTGMSLSSGIYVGATKYPPSDNATTMPKPTDTSQILSLVSSGSAVFGFALAAGGLGWRHHILDKLSADPGRGLFIGGTVVGAIGVLSIVASYVVGFSSFGTPRDRSIIALATSLGGASLCNSGTAMYAKDSANLLKVWKKLTTF